MEDIIKNAAGQARIELTGAFPEGVLNACAAEGILFWQTESIDAYTLRITVTERELPSVEALARRGMCDVKILSTRGGKKLRARFRRRKFLLIGILFLTALLLWSSRYIWDIEVTGCRELTRTEVLRLLDDCGVRIGTYWPTLNADTVRSRMLLADGRIAWMTVNVRSSRAEVVVRETQKMPESVTARFFTAERSGIVRRVSVLRGDALVQVGQAVTEGEPLIASTENETVLGEVWADTWVEVQAKMPSVVSEKTAVRKKSTRWALIWGEKRINFYNSSRKKLDGCDKIEKRFVCAIDGVFTLPITVVREELIEYALTERPVSDEETDAVRLRLLAGLDGVRFSHSETAENGGSLTVTVRAQCLENIAKPD